MRIEWLFSMITGPVVGGSTASTPEAVWEIVYVAFRSAVGPGWSPTHESAVRAIRADVIAGGESVTETGQPWEFNRTGIVVTLHPDSDKG